MGDLRLIAEEVLRISKMNWNTFDLYTKVPATSSNEIARIGSLLDCLAHAPTNTGGLFSYDFPKLMPENHPFDRRRPRCVI
jgi:hypothetical protein